MNHQLLTDLGRYYFRPILILVILLLSIVGVPAYAQDLASEYPDWKIAFEPSGTKIEGGQLYIRLDFYPPYGSQTFEEQYVYDIDKGSSEYQEGYKGDPKDLVAYKFWLDSLPRAWKLNPAICVFVAIGFDTNISDLEAFIENTYTPDTLATLDNSLVQPNDIHLISPYMRDKTTLASDTSLENLPIVKDITNSYFSGLECTVRDGGVATTINPESISIGTGVADHSSSSTSQAMIDAGNPSTADGTIDTVKTWFKAGGGDGADFEFWTIAMSGNNGTTNDGTTIGAVTAGSEQTFAGLTVGVATGDYAGAEWSGGSIEKENSGGSGYWVDPYPRFPCVNNAFGFAAGRTISLLGTGNETGASAPTLTALTVSDILATSANVTGNVTATGGENPTVLFYYGKTDGGETPASWTSNSSPTTPSQPQGVGQFIINLSGLDSGTIYYVKASANNTGGTTWTSTVNFTTLSGITAPTVVTNAVASVEETTATASGNITATSENCTAWGFEWDTDSGVPYTNNYTYGGSRGVGNFTYAMTGLTKGELYYLRATANNSGGQGVGTEVTFLTKPDPASAFTSTDNGTTWLALSWTNGTGMDYVEVRYDVGTTAPADNTSGTLGYWGTGTTANVTGLTASTTYAFRIFTHVTEGGLWNTADNNPTCLGVTDAGAVVIHPPTNLVLTDLGAGTIGATYVQGINSTYTMLRISTTHYPATVTDGELYYYGNLLSANFSGLSLDINTGYVSGWGYAADNITYSSTCTTASIGGGNMVFLSILAFCGIMSFASIRNTFFGLKLLAGMSWFALFIYLKDNPPGAITEGSGAHVALLIVAIGFGLMVVLAGLGRGIQKSQKWNTGEEMESGGFRWRLPEWMKFNEDEPTKRTKSTDEALRDYKETIRRAYRTGESSDRKRK